MNTKNKNKENTPEKQDQGSKELKDIIDLANDMIGDAQQKLSDVSEQLILIGNTGSGKSTIFSGLRNDKLIVQTQRLQTIIANKSVNGCIGNGPESKTKQINTYRKSNKVCIVDTPGFGDTGNIQNEQSDQNSSSKQNIANTLLIKSILESNTQNKIILVLDLSTYQQARQTQVDPIVILTKMIDNLSDFLPSIGIIINKSDERHEDRVVINLIAEYYKKQPEISKLIRSIEKQGNIRQLARPAQNLEGKNLNVSYFDKIQNLIEKLQSAQFQKVNIIFQNANSKLLVETFVQKIKQSMNNLMNLKEIKFDLPEFNKKIQYRREFKDKIENFQLRLRENEKFAINLSQHSNAVEQIFQMSNLILEMKNKEIEEHMYPILKDVKYISSIISKCDLQKIFDDMVNFYNHQVNEYIKNTTQYIQNHQDLKYQLPEKCEKSFIHVARLKVADKSLVEKGVDFLFTFGNERYLDYYYIIIKRDNGKHFIQEMIHENEINASGLRLTEEFDNRELVLIQTIVINSLLQLAYLIERGSDQNCLEVKLLLKQLENKIGKKHSQDINEQVFNMLGQLGKQAVNTAVLQSVVKVTILETFKVVNNALLKEGVKGFLGIGGKEMMRVGAQVVIRQAGKEIASGAVKEVSKQAVVIGSKQALSTAASFGLSLVANALVGGIKSIINTGWKKETTYLCESFQSFTFEEINNFEKSLKDLKEKINNKNVSI